MRQARGRLPHLRLFQRQWRIAQPPQRFSELVPSHQPHPKLFSSRYPRPQTHFVNAFFSPRGPHEDSTKSSPEGTEEEILARARAYNIQTFSQLDFESNVAPNQFEYRKGSRLVDRLKYSEDFYLWTILLDWQRLKNGDPGVRSIWEGIKCRGGLTNLPFVGYQGDKLWPAFVSAGVQNIGFLQEVVRFEVKNGCQRPRFFVEVVGALLKSANQSSALNFARTLQVAHRPDKYEIFNLFVIAAKSENVNAIKTFYEIYATMPPSGIYGMVIAHLFDDQRASDAWMMHRFLISRSDLPQSFRDLQPIVQDLVDNNMRLESLLHELSRAGVSMEAQAKTFYAQQRSLRLGFSSENLNIVVSNTFGVQPRTLSDDFVARAISTNTFSFESTIGGLRLFGLKTIGPSSMRAIGLTSANAQELCGKLDKLTALEIDTGSSRFVRVVKRLARQGKESMLQNVLHSDQHSDVFEDLTMQRRLLRRYYLKEDWPGVGRTLAVLTVDSDESDVRHDAVNFKLRAALAVKKWDHVRKIMVEMLRDRSKYHPATIALMLSVILPKRMGMPLPAEDPNFDRLGFLVSMWLDVLKSGTMIPVERWKEPIRRLGMYGRIDEVETLLFQLLFWYGEDQNRGNTGDKIDHRNAIRRLISPRLQSAIVHWGFLHNRGIQPQQEIGLPFGKTVTHPSTRGVQFLRNLKDRYDCEIDTDVVKRTCLQRLRQIFSIKTESILRRNRRSSSRNEKEFWFFVESLERAWTEPLFRDRRKLWRLMDSRLHINSRQYRRVRTRRWRARRIWKHKEVDVEDMGQHTVRMKTPQDTEQESVPTDIVLPGGLFSQAYWSLKN